MRHHGCKVAPVLRCIRARHLRRGCVGSVASTNAERDRRRWYENIASRIATRSRKIISSLPTDGLARSDRLEVVSWPTFGLASQRSTRPSSPRDGGTRRQYDAQLQDSSLQGLSNTCLFLSWTSWPSWPSRPHLRQWGVYPPNGAGSPPRRISSAQEKQATLSYLFF